MKLSKRDALLVYVIIKERMATGDDDERLAELGDVLEQFLTEENSSLQEEEEEEESDSEEEEVEPDGPVSAALLEDLPSLKVALGNGSQTTLEFEASDTDVDSTAAILGTGDVIEDVVLLHIHGGEVRLHADGSPGWHIFKIVGRIPKKWKAIADGSVYEILAEDE